MVTRCRPQELATALIDKSAYRTFERWCVAASMRLGMYFRSLYRKLPFFVTQHTSISGRRSATPRTSKRTKPTSKEPESFSILEQSYSTVKSAILVRFQSFPCKAAFMTRCENPSFPCHAFFLLYSRVSETEPIGPGAGAISGACRLGSPPLHFLPVQVS